MKNPNRSRSYTLFVCLMLLLGLSGCNVSDEGGGLAADCTENQDCVTGVCVDGECRGVEMDAGNNGIDASNNVTTDAGDDTGESDAGADMAIDMGPECPEGRVDRNGDPSDGCELPAHPAANDPACEPCWNLQDAVGGCSEGSCKIVACLNGKTDRDGQAMTGCEEDCGPGECWTPIGARQEEYLRIADDWIIGSGNGVAAFTRDQGQTLNWIHSDSPRDFVEKTPTDYAILDDNRVVGVQKNTIVVSDDLGLSWRATTLPTAFGATSVTSSNTGRGVAGGFSGTCGVRQCPAEPCSGDETCNAGVCEGRDCNFDSDCLSGSICGANNKCVDPGNVVCRSGSECGNATCNLVGNRLLISDDFETWATSGVQVPWAFESVFTNSDGSIIMATSGPTVRRTIDDGDTWQEIDVAPCPFVNEIAWNSTDRVVLGGDSCLQVSQDDGASFSPSSFPGGVGKVRALHWVDDATVLAGGTDVILRSTDAGLNWVRTDVVGSVTNIQELTDGTLVAMSDFQGVWTSSDAGSNWTSVRESRFPLPNIVSAGGVGVAGSNASTLSLPPSQTSIDGPWTGSTVSGVKEIQQFGGNEAFVATSGGLWWGTDFSNVSAQPIDPNRINTEQITLTFNGNPIPCGTTGTITITCQVTNTPPIRQAAYNGATTYVATTLRITAIIRILSNTNTTTFTVNPLISSTDKSNWAVIREDFTPLGRFVPTLQGMISNRSYSTAPDRLQAITDNRCDEGPFLVRDDGEIVSFDTRELCISTSGSSWSTLATANDFGTRLGSIRNPITMGGTNIGVQIESGSADWLVVSEDNGQNWQDLGVSMLPNTTIASDGTRHLASHYQMLLRSE